MMPQPFASKLHSLDNPFRLLGVLGALATAACNDAAGPRDAAGSIEAAGRRILCGLGIRCVSLPRR